MSGYRGLRPSIWWFTPLIVLMTCCSRNEGPATAEHWRRLLPPAPQGWEVITPARVFSGVGLSDYINGGAEAYLAYGFRELVVREFSRKDGRRLTLEIYEMDRPENAYGIFSTDSAGEKWEIGADASYGSGLLRFWKGPFFARILCFPADRSIESIVRETGAQVADAITDPGRRPDLLSLLPEDNILPDSVCYFHRQTSLNNIRFLGDENLLHLGDDVEALTWKQKLFDARTGESNVRQIVLLYPSADRAEAAFSEFVAKYMHDEPAQSSNADVVAGRVSDAECAAAFRARQWLLVALDAASPEAAAEAVNATRSKIDSYSAKRKGGTQ